MILDCKITLKFKKLHKFSIKEFYFNPCLLSIQFDKSTGINNFILMEMDRCETWDDDEYVYSKLSGFTPMSDEEEFISRHFDSLSELVSKLDKPMFNPQVSMNPLNYLDEEFNPNDFVKFISYEISGY